MSLLFRCFLILNICLLSGFNFAESTYNNAENSGESKISKFSTSHTMKAVGASKSLYSEGQSHSENSDCCQDCYDCATCCFSFLNAKGYSLRIAFRKNSALIAYELTFKSTYLLEIYRPPISHV